jgi:predicted secreted hydrolase
VKSVLAAAVVLVVGACSGAPILANPPVIHPLPVVTQPPAAAVADPQPIAFPRDDGPHRRLTEWWYYTGHLATGSGRRFGFEFVIFRAERGAFPVSWASHLALTDEQGRRFLYGQRSEIGPQVDRSARGADGVPEAFSLSISGFDPLRPAAITGAPWTMDGASGRDRLAAALAPAEAAAAGQPASFALDLRLSTERPPVLHDRIGFVAFGPAGGSYYYSRPRMSAGGTIQVEADTFQVTGEAWFDHQWGDFIAVGGGWDWFAVNLGDGSALTLSLVRDPTSTNSVAYGTLVDADGTFQHLSHEAFTVDVVSHWASDRTGTTYPAKWRVQLPRAGLDIILEPTIPDQELDTRPTTGVVYWEGSQRVSAIRNGLVLGGEAYVELTGYATGGP